MLVSYDSHIIYYIYLFNKRKIIQIKNFESFENIKKKQTATLFLIMQLQCLKIISETTYLNLFYIQSYN